MYRDRIIKAKSSALINKSMHKGKLVIISSPSGGGKTSVIHRLMQRDRHDYRYSVSATTRAPRPGEVDGTDYIFLSEEVFRAWIDAGRFVEWEHVHKYYYGTPREPIDNWLEEGRIVLLDIDVKGGIDIKQQFGDRALSIFLDPPSVDALIERLGNRKTDSQDEIEKRLTRVPLEVEKGAEYEYRIVNENLNETVEQVENIITKHIV